MSAPATSTRRPYARRMPAGARREQLLDAALQIINRDGYGAVSVDAIAREAGVTRPVVYRVFADLRELLAALLDRQEQRALAGLLARVGLPEPATDPALVARRLVGDLVEMVRSDPDTWRPIFVTFGDAPPEVRDRIAADRAVVRRRFARLLRTAGLAADVDPDVLAHALVAIGEYFGRLILADPDAVDPQLLATTLSSLLSGVLGTAPGTAAEPGAAGPPRR